MPSSDEESTDEKNAKAFELLNSDAPVRLLLSNEEADRLKVLDKKIFALIEDIRKRRKLSHMQCCTDLLQGDPLKDIRDAIISVEEAMANPRHLSILAPR